LCSPAPVFFFIKRLGYAFNSAFYAEREIESQAVSRHPARESKRLESSVLWISRIRVVKKHRILFLVPVNFGSDRYLSGGQTPEIFNATFRGDTGTCATVES